jgi:hypothetical protein
MANGLALEIDTSDIDRLLKEFPQYEHIIFEEMEAAMYSSLAIFQEQVQGRTPVGVSGDLRKNILPITRGLPPNFIGEVQSGMFYGEYVERGRRPGRQPPVEAIELWVQRKLGVSPDESRNVAYLIARAIGRRGTSGAAMFDKGFEAGKEPVEKLWSNVVDKASKRIDAEMSK